LSYHLNAQEAAVLQETEVNTKQEKLSYYEQRGAEDANYEVQFKTGSKRGEESFWQEQKTVGKFKGGQYEHTELICKEKTRMQSTIIVVMGITTIVIHYQHAEFYYYQYDRRKLRKKPRSPPLHK
jgi:competence transcription factor ComK